MRRNLAIPGLFLLLMTTGFHQGGGMSTPSVLNAAAADDGEKKITAVLERMVRERRTYLLNPA